MPIKTIKFILLFVGIAIVSTGCLSLADDITPPPGYVSPTRTLSTSTPEDTAEDLEQTITYPVIPPNPANGEDIYQEKCLPCHGENGLGDGPQANQLPNPVPPLGDPDVARAASPAGWYNIVTNGNIERFMPPFKSLSDRQRWDVVAYLYTLSVDEETLTTGQAVFSETCAECHGDRGQGSSTSEARVFIDQSQMAFKSHNSLFDNFTSIEEHTEMQEITDLEIHDALDYIRRLTFTQTESIAAAETPETEPTQAEAESIQSTPETSSGEEIPLDIPEGTVTIEVLRPSGDPLPEGLPVVLRGYDHMTEVYSNTVTLDSEGLAEMEEIPLPPGRILLATIDYEQASYGSDVYVIEDGDTAIELAINVYETTTDVSGLSVDRLHVFFDFLEEGVIQVVELFVISNPGERTIVAEEAGAPVLEFRLPPKATNLTFRDGTLGDRYIKTELGFADTINIRPGSGQYQVMFGYDIPYPDNEADLELPISMPTTSVIVMAPESGVKIRSDDLSFNEVREVEGVSYQLLSSGMVQSGESLDLQVSGWPKFDRGAAIEPEQANQNLMLGIGILGGVLIAVGIFLWQRNRNQPQTWEDDEEYYPPEVDGPETAEELIDAIIALDELYVSGELPEEAYNNRRADLKNRLNNILEDEAE